MFWTLLDVDASTAGDELKYAHIGRMVLVFD
jgi:hypothetical protein